MVTRYKKGDKVIVSGAIFSVGGYARVRPSKAVVLSTHAPTKDKPFVDYLVKFTPAVYLVKKHPSIRPFAEGYARAADMRKAA